MILRPFFAPSPRSWRSGDRSTARDVRVLLALPAAVASRDDTVAILDARDELETFLLPLVVLSEADSWTLPIGVTNFSTQYTTDTARVLAFTSLAMVPALLFYLVAERQFVKGLTGAVKG